MIAILYNLFLLGSQTSPGTWDLAAQIKSPERGEHFSEVLASIGDLDGDGVRELIIGAPDTRLGLHLGAVAVHSGRTGLRLHYLRGLVGSGRFGGAVSSAGDVDGDGLEDILVGARSATYLGQWLGAAFVYSGFDGHLIHRILGSSADPGYQGTGVSWLADWNNDGYDDFLVSDNNDRVIPGVDGIIRLYSGLDASVLLEIGVPFGVGGRLRAIQDVNGDDFPDILTPVGGAVAVLSGRDGTEIRRHLARHPGASNFGSALAGLGDTDRDGVEDYVIGAPHAFSNLNPGRVFVYSGKTGALRFEIVGRQPGGNFGISAAGPGDTDGDGCGDILVGAWRENHTSVGNDGAAHLFSGFDGSHLASFEGDALPAHVVGWAVSDLGDVNGDGLGDFAIGSGTNTHGQTGDGVARIYALRSYLRLSERTVSASTGGTLDFRLDFPDTEAGNKYVLLASGGASGRTRAGGVWLPLAPTPLLDQMVNNAPAFLTGARGRLDAQGEASAAAVLAPHQLSTWAGRSLKFVAISLDPAGGISLHSAAMPLQIVP